MKTVNLPTGQHHPMLPFSLAIRNTLTTSLFMALSSKHPLSLAAGTSLAERHPRGRSFQMIKFVKLIVSFIRALFTNKAIKDARWLQQALGSIEHAKSRGDLETANTIFCVLLSRWYYTDHEDLWVEIEADGDEEDYYALLWICGKDGAACMPLPMFRKTLRHCALEHARLVFARGEHSREIVESYQGSCAALVTQLGITYDSAAQARINTLKSDMWAHEEPVVEESGYW
jgi:hypothetical protein